MGLFSMFSKSNNLLFPGCYMYFKNNPDFELWKRILGKLSIDFREIEKKICCGLPAYEAGYESEARKLSRRNFEIFKEEKIQRIITLCPQCYKSFLIDYKEFLPDWNIEVVNIFSIILDKLENKFLIKNKADEEVCFQDSCYLGRYCSIYDEPRKILALIGYRIKEMNDSKEKSICSGSCGGLPITHPNLADKIAKEKILKVKRTGIKKLIVMSYQEYELLKKNSENSGIEIVLFSDVLGNALGVK